MHLKWKHQFQFAGYYAAIEKGFYKEHGLDVSLLEPSYNTDSAEAVLVGDAEFGVGNSDLLLYKYRGAPFVVLGVIFQQSPLSLVIRTDKARDIFDLVGNNIMLSPDTSELIVLLQSLGLPATRLNITSCDYTPDDFFSGELAAMSAYISNEPYTAAKQSVPYIEYRPIDYGIDFYGDNFFTTTDMVVDKPKVVEGFRLATLKGWKYAIENQAEIVDLILAKYSTKHSRESLLNEAKILSSLVTRGAVPVGHMDLAKWENIADTYTTLGMLPKYYSLKGFIYTKDRGMYKKYLIWSAYLAGGGGIVLFILLVVYRNNVELKRQIEVTRNVQIIGSIGDWVYDAERREFDLSEGAQDIIGVSGHSRLSYDAFFDLVHRRDVKTLESAWHSFFETGELDCNFRVGSGKDIHWINVRAGHDYSTLGRKDTYIGYFHNITEKMTLEKQMKLIATVFDVSAQAIVITDTAGIIKAVNPAFTTITGYDREEAIGQNPRILKSGVHPPEFYDEMWRSLIEEGFWEGELWNRKKDGSVYLEWNTITAIKDSDGDITEFVAQFSDIIKRKLTEEELRVKNNYDGLTNLANRNLFIDSLDQMLVIASKEHATVATIYIDLDKFKVINDGIGYSKGDQVLIEIGKRLKSIGQEADIVARSAADEFLIALYRDTEDLSLIIDEIKLIPNTICSPINIDGENVTVSGSVGVVISPIYDGKANEILNYAELAMHKAKGLGGNDICFYEHSISKLAMEAYELEKAISDAIVNDEFVVYLQPVSDVKSGKIIGAEALVRWDHPEKGMIFPDTFIPIAEKSGYINIIGLMVLDEACKALLEIKKIMPDFYLTINVAPSQIPFALDPEVAYNSISGFGLDPSSVVLELVESSFLSDQNEAQLWMQKIKRFGIRLALDDFGTGYSSLSYLNMYPFDIMKIDRSFITNLSRNKSNFALVESMITMAHKLNMKVIAEGIEDAETIEILTNLGCDSIQGYYISKPKPIPEIIEFLKEKVAE